MERVRRKPRVYEWLSESRIAPAFRQIGARLRVRSIGPRRFAKFKGPTRSK